MATLQQIKRRITSVKGTQKITKAMKMVAAAKLRRAQENIVQARPYAFKLREVQSEIAARVSPDMHPLLQKRTPKKVVYLIVTADRGLCEAALWRTCQTGGNDYRLLPGRSLSGPLCCGGR